MFSHVYIIIPRKKQNSQLLEATIFQKILIFALRPEQPNLDRSPAEECKKGKQTVCVNQR